jgi:hypothetical protein
LPLSGCYQEQQIGRQGGGQHEAQEFRNGGFDIHGTMLALPMVQEKDPIYISI